MKPITDFLFEFWQQYFFWVNTFVPIILALLVFGAFLWKQRKASSAFLAGLISIVLLWLAVEWWVYSGFLECQRLSAAANPTMQGISMCGEWVGVGMVLYAANALLDAFIFSGLAYGISILYKNLASKITSLPQRTRPQSIRLIGVVVLTLVVASVGGGFIGKQAADLINSGALIRWQPVSESLEAVEKKFAAGNQSNALTTWGVCAIEFQISSPPGEVAKSVEIMSCSAASKRLSKYVLLQDGSYWLWKYEINSDITVLANNFIAVTLGSISGFLCGVFLSVRIATNRPVIPSITNVLLI